jgi:hypothetical protein
LTIADLEGEKSETNAVSEPEGHREQATVEIRAHEVVE